MPEGISGCDALLNAPLFFPTAKCTKPLNVVNFNAFVRHARNNIYRNRGIKIAVYELALRILLTYGMLWYAT